MAKGRPRLKPGEDTISAARVKERDDGTMRLQWRYCSWDGQTHLMDTRIKTTRKSDVVRKARETCKEALAAGVGQRRWKRSSEMREYIDSAVTPALKENAKLRPRTKERYEHSIRLYRDEVGSRPIEHCVRASVLRADFQDIAERHGTATARKTATTVGKYVMRRLVNDEVITANPLRDLDLELPEVVAREHTKGGVALTAGERERCVAWLATWQPNPEAGYHGVSGRGNVVAKWQAARDVTLLQATSGMRIGEVLALTKGEVGEGDGYVTATVSEETSKTHKGRVAVVTDGRAADMLRARRDAAADGSSLVFPSPSSPDKAWDRSNAHKAVRRLYDMMADELDIPALKSLSTHSWRTTLNTEWIDRGIPVEYRVAQLGHDPSANRRFYSDTSHADELARMLTANA